MINWDDHRIFLAVARESSVRKAAAMLGVSHSTVLRRITAFENALGVRLFERLPTGYFATPAGEDMLETALRIEQETLTASRRVAGRDKRLSGSVRVTISGALVTNLLMPDLVAFSRNNPEITLEVVPTYALADLARREADVAIRLSNNPPEDLVGRRLVTIARAAYVTKEFLPAPGPMKKPRALKWLGWPGDSPNKQWIEDSDFPDVPIGASFGDPQVQFEAAKAGAGMALLPCFMGDAEPALYRMPPGVVRPYMDIWVLTHKDLRNTARVRRVLNDLADAILQKRDLIEGKIPRTLPKKTGF